MRALWTLSLLTLTAVACHGPEPAPAPAAADSASTPSATPVEVHSSVAVAALEEAAVALAAWRDGVEAGERLDDGEILRLRGVTRSVGRELQALMDEVEAHDAALRSDPGAQGRHELLTMQARMVAQPWIEAVHEPDEGRDTTLGLVREALSSEDEAQQLAALVFLRQIDDVAFDRSSFRPLVLPVVREASRPLLVAALDALHAVDPRPADLALVHAAWERDPSGLGYQTLRLLRVFDEGRLEGRSEEIALACLADVDGRRVNLQLHGLWGAWVGPELEARVLELSHSSDPQIRHAALYFGLATFEDKSGPVVEALIEALADPDPDRWERALWGLGRGVPRERQSRVAEALVDFRDRCSDPQVRARCASLVDRYGGPEYAERLRR